MEKTAEDTSRIYYNACKDLKPNMALLEADVIPSRVLKGKEVNHRIRYAICQSSVNTPNGEIIRKVYFGDMAVFQDRTKYEFKQGIWTVDAFILVPENARSGVYEVDTVISYRGKSMKIRNTFEVKTRDQE
jgi:hypothetical protein